jgi:predicted dienelactone hydrolase
MRLLEVVVLLLWLASLLETWLARGRIRRPELVLAGLTGVLLEVQFLVERPRLALLPLYLAIGVHLLLVLVGYLRFRPAAAAAWAPRRWARALSFAAGIVIVVLVVVPGVLLPVPDLPTPQGPFPVGVTQYEWADPARAEPYSPEPTEKRRVQVRVWYPAKPGPDSTKADLWGDFVPLASTLLRSLGLGWVPPQLLGDYALTDSHAWRDAPVAKASRTLPVLLFSPGYGSPLSVYSVFLEDLASRGYVVVSIGHPYQNPLVWADGTVLPQLDVQAWLKRTPTQQKALDAEFDTLYREALAAPDSPSVWQALAERNFGLRKQTLLPVDLQLWTQDSRFVLDQVFKLNAGELDRRFAGRLDLTRIGAFGHSFGGATAAELLLTDPRVKAAANLDGTQEGTVLGKALPGPFLLAQEGEPQGHVGNQLNKVLYAASPGLFWTLEMVGAVHNDFSDLPRLSPLLQVVGLTSSGGAAVQDTTTRFLVEFFNQTLLGRPSPLLAKTATTDTWSLTKR